MTHISAKLSRKLTLEQITAGCVKHLGVSVGCLRGKSPQYNNHRKIWYAVLWDLSGQKMLAVSHHVQRGRATVHAALSEMTESEKKQVESICENITQADFG